VPVVNHQSNLLFFYIINPEKEKQEKNIERSVSPRYLKPHKKTRAFTLVLLEAKEFYNSSLKH
jgi:hypothetical protein